MKQFRKRFRRYLSIPVGMVAFALGLMLAVDAPESERPKKSAKPDRPDEAVRWFTEQRAYPGEIPLDWKQRAYDHIRDHNLTMKAEPGVLRKGTTALSWTEVGPGNIGGRIRSIAVDPSNSNIIYVGSVSGGVWKSTNAGSSWSPTNDFADNLAITSLAIDPTNSNVIYAGTGEGFFNIDAVRGAGMLKTTNGGGAWGLQTSFTGGGFPYFINDLYLRPDSVNIVFAATNTGLYRTTNGGTTWVFRHQGSSARSTQIVRDHATPTTFYVSYGNFSTDGIYKTTNGGTSFSKLTSGLPTSGYLRISMAISASNSSVLYASFCDASTYGTLGVYKTTNGGSSWSAVTTPMDPQNGGTHLGQQGWYDNVIAVDPANENIVYAGGINLYKSTNGGGSWAMISNWYTGSGWTGPYVHADQHAIAFSGSNIYFGNDGGFFRSTNGGASFTEMNNGLATIQFYSGAVHPASDIYYGGTQDNGTLKSGTLPNWSMVFGGDGGHTAVNYNTPTTVYTEYVYLNIQKSTNSGGSWTRSMSGIPTSGSGPYDGTSDRCLFIAPITMDPTSPANLAAGTYRIFYSNNNAGSWSAISADLTGDGPGGVGTAGSTISAIAIAKTSSATIYVGTSGSETAAPRVQVTTNTGSTWTNTTASPLPSRYVTFIAIDPTNADRAIVCYSGYNSNTPSTPGHVFLTTNRGSTWTNASGNLPDIPVNAAIISPVNSQRFIIGTDLGVFESVNGGSTWTQENTGMANVVVSDLDLRGDGYVFAATHGRGMFKTTSPVAVHNVLAEVPGEFRLAQNFPNPFNPSTVIRFSLPVASHATLKIYDAVGQEVATLVDERLSAGSFEVDWNGREFASGVYFYRLRADQFAEQRKMMLMK
jgi:photosystem II stability/assembly factor-like uncharacterized protein